jgi:hypothetical protein
LRYITNTQKTLFILTITSFLILCLKLLLANLSVLIGIILVINLILTYINYLDNRQSNFLAPIILNTILLSQPTAMLNTPIIIVGLVIISLLGLCYAVSLKIKFLKKKQIYLILGLLMLLDSIFINSFNLANLNKNDLINTCLAIIPWLVISTLANSRIVLNLLVLLSTIILISIKPELQIILLFIFSLYNSLNINKLTGVNHYSALISHLYSLLLLIIIASYIGLNIFGIPLYGLVGLELTLCLFGIIIWGQTPFLKTILLIMMVYILLNATILATFTYA